MWKGSYEQKQRLWSREGAVSDKGQRIGNSIFVELDFSVNPAGIYLDIDRY